MSVQNGVSEGDFHGDEFVVKSGLIGTTYVIKMGTGEELLWARRRFFADGLTYLYSDDADELRFRYEDVTGGDNERFRFVEEESGQQLATLERVDEHSRYRWQLETERDGIRVQIVGEEGTTPVLDPQKGRHMTVTDTNGESVGSVDRRLLAIHFMFDVEFEGLDDVTKAAVLLAVPLLYDAMRYQSSGWDQ